jgi:hypothetical protein
MHDLSTAQALETHAAILEKLRCCLPHLAPHLQLGVRIADLGIDSIDLVELLCLVSSEFDLRLSEPEYRSLRTVGDLVAFIAEQKKGGQQIP